VRHSDGRQRVLQVLVALVLSSLIANRATAQSDVATLFDPAKQATVFLMQTYSLGNTQVLSCVGSGTLISPTGLILTNAHLAEPLGPCRGDRIVVALPVRPEEPPIPTYLAEVVQVDMRLDIATLQVAQGLDGSLIDPQTLNLPYAQMGDPGAVSPGTTLTYVGYPDIGTTSAVAISAPIIGITAEKSGGSSAWFRMDAPLGGTMSGGGAYDAHGRLVGIPTSASPTPGVPGPSCLSLQDNTRDGLITEADACVPVGGPITQVRPINYAAPLIEAGRNNLRLAHSSGLPLAPLIGEPRFERLFFSTGVSEAGVPTHIISSAPTGTSSLFLFFDYIDLQPGTPYELRVTNNGLDMPQFSLGPLAWGGGRQGTWYIGTQGKTWPDGNYEFTLLISGQAVAAQSIVVGGTPTEPAFTDLVFGIPDAAGGFAATGTLLPAQVQQVDARFDFHDMPDGQVWTEVWYLDGTEVSRIPRTWDQGENGQGVVSAINYAGLPLGSYRLELYIGDRLAATGDVILAGNSGLQGEPAIFSNARIASAISREGLPAGQIGSVMPLGVNTLNAFVDWDLMPNGISWTYRWYLDGRLVASSTQPWDAGGAGNDYWVSLVSDQPLPEGSYAVEVLVESRPMFSANVSIGSGTQPLSGIQSASDEVIISGTVLDALTGEAISGALVVVLDVTLESPQFTWNESQIHTQAIADEQGRFFLPRGLARGNFYTVFVFAEGYITIIEDNFTILRNQPSPVDIRIEMERP